MATNVVPSSPAVATTLSTVFELWTPSRPIESRSAWLFLGPAAAGRMAFPWLLPIDREPLRQQTAATFDIYTEQGSKLLELFDDTFGRSGISQMKIMKPKPGVRLVGAFADPAVFVGLRLYLRHELPFKQTGQQGVIDYKTLNTQMVAEWNGLLPGIPRLQLKDL